MPPRPSEAPDLGVGVGLRPVHSGEVIERGRRGELRVGWLEAISENYMVPGGRPLRVLDEVRSVAPLVLHGVSLNIGSNDPLDADYLDALAGLVARIEPRWISDHLCWTGVGGRNLHDLMPLPHTGDAVLHVAARIARVQDRLGRRIAVENVSSYVRFASDELSEWDFLVAVAEEADCGILLDVNNVFVNACNHGFEAERFIDAVPAERVFQIHLAGHSTAGPLRIDTHDDHVCEEVWALYARAIRRLGPVSTLVEWDDRIPAFAVLEAEAERARSIRDAVLGEEPCDDATRRSAGPRRAAAATLAARHGA